MPSDAHTFTLGPNLDSPLQSSIAEWFQAKGTSTLIAEDRGNEAPYDYLAFARESQLFTRTMVPERLGSEDAQWNPKTIFETSENLAFHGFMNWLMWHVTYLGTLPVWMSENSVVQRHYVEALEWGMPSAYGMSEKAAGADWKHTVTELRMKSGKTILSGEKNYAGNAQFSPIITTFVKDRRDSNESFAFVVVSAGKKGYRKRGNAVSEQMYVCDFTLNDYAVSESSLIQSGPQAFNDAVNTINIGKVNLASAALGVHSRILMETYGHLSSRSIFGKKTADFGQNRQNLAVAALRSHIMRAFLAACRNSMERASNSDQRYIVLNSIAKVLVTEMAERSIIDLTDAASALTFEADSPIYSLRNYVGYLPRLEGTKYVNIMQSTKSMNSYFSGSGLASDSGGPVGPEYLLSQRSLGGFKKTRFGGWQEKLASAGKCKQTQLLIQAVSEIASWAGQNPVALADGDERLIQAAGEVYFKTVAICEISENAEYSREILQSMIGLMSTDLASTVIAHRNALDQTGLRCRAVIESLSGIDWEIPEDHMINEIDREAKRLAASLHTFNGGDC